MIMWSAANIPVNFLIVVKLFGTVLINGNPEEACHQVQEKYEIQNDLHEIHKRFHVNILVRTHYHFLNSEDSEHFGEGTYGENWMQFLEATNT